MAHPSTLRLVRDPSAPPEAPAVPEGNVYDRYETRNPFARLLVDRYVETLQDMLAGIEFDSMLDAGTGDGQLLARLVARRRPQRVVGLDLSARLVAETQARFPDFEFRRGSVLDLPFEDRSFDLVVAADVLQQLHDPQRALRELGRVTRRWVLLTVPREPLWRVLNLVRLAYVHDLGSPPGAVQRYRRGDFVNMVRGHFRIMRLELPTPWVAVLARKGA